MRPSINVADTSQSEIETLLSRAETSGDPVVQTSLLIEASRRYEAESEPEHAFLVRATAYRVAPSPEARAELERLALVTSRLAELDALVAETLPSQSQADGALAACDLGRLRLRRMRSPERALEALDLALTLGAGDEALTLRADALEELGRFAELATVLSDLAGRARPDEAARLYLRLADVCERNLDDAERAEAACRAALAIDGNDTAVTQRLDRLVRARGDLPSLLALVEERITRTPHDQQAAPLRQAAELCERMGRHAEAAAHWEAVRRLQAGDLQPLRALERLYGELGRLRQQIEVLEELVGLVESRREHAVLHRKLAAAWIELGEPARAIASLEWQMAYDAASPAFETLRELYRDEGRFGALADAYSRHLQVAEPRRRRTLRIELAEIYEHKLNDIAQAIACWQAILDDDERDGEALEGLARLYETIDDCAAAGEMAERWAALAGDGHERAMRLASAAAFTARVDETSRAHRLFERAHAADPSCLPARIGLTASYRRRGDLARADQLIAEALASDDGGNPELAAEVAALREAEGDLETALALRKAIIARVPGDLASRQKAASLALKLGGHEEALRLALPLPDDGTSEARVERWLTIARAAHAGGKLALAGDALAQAAALAPTSFEVGKLRIEQLLLDRRVAEADAVVSELWAHRDRLPLGERSQLEHLAADCAEARGDGEAALAHHLEGLGIDAGNRVALRKALDLSVALSRWNDCLVILGMLVAIEEDRRIRARYRHLAGHVCEENLDDVDRALGHYRLALDDDLGHPRAAERIEAVLRARGDFPALAEHCAHLIGRLGEHGDAVLRARLWTLLADAAAGMNDREGTIAALEVVARLDPTARDARRRLAALYLQAGPHATDKAIAAQHELLRVDAAHVPAYRALAALYDSRGELARAEDCQRAARLLSARDVSRDARRGWTPAPEVATRPFTGDDWALLRHPDEDRFVSALAMMVAPLLTATAALPLDRARKSAGTPVPRNDMRPFVQAVNQVSRLLGMPTPELFIAEDQLEPLRVVWGSVKDTIKPLLIVGRSLAADKRRAVDLVPQVALDLVQLRPERNLRLLVHQPEVLAVILRAVIAVAYDEEPEADARITAAALRRWMAPVVLDQLAVVGRRLREDGRDLLRLAATWLRAADLTAARVAMVITGDLERTLSAVEARAADERAARAALPDLVYASISDELWTVRRRLNAN